MSTQCPTCGQTTEYNGWSNYATWGCKLILDNDQYCYDVVHEMAHAVSRDDEGRWKLQDDIRDFVEELCGLEGNAAPTPSDMARQLLSAAICDVNWREIAKSLLSDLEDEDPEEEDE